MEPMFTQLALVAVHQYHVGGSQVELNRFTNVDPATPREVFNIEII